MFTLAALSMGYRVVVLDPDPHSPAGLLATRHIKADYRDHAALQLLGDECAAVTTEFENVPADTLEYLETLCPVRPSPAAVRIAQDRILEKRFIRDHGLDTAKFATIEETGDFEVAIEEGATLVRIGTAIFGSRQ